MAVPACCRIWARLRLAVSEAKSASMMRPLAAVWFSTALCRKFTVFWKRLWAAPREARLSLIVCRALSMASMLAALELLLPAAVVRALVVAPTWKSKDAVVVSTEVPLNCTALMVRPISEASWVYSWFSEATSDEVLVELVACTASSRMRCSMSETVCMPLSAVCSIEMPSLALRMATLMPRAWASMRVAMARPAASSLALLTRRPEDRRWIEVDRLIWVAEALRWAFSELMLVLMVIAMGRLLQ